MSGAVHKFEPTPDQHLALRRAFGCFGTGVTVVTTLTADGPLGMTANSFSSISLDPPLVLWAPALRSKRHDAFVQATEFCVHVLAADQLAVANHFAQHGSGFDRFDWAQGPYGAPVLSGCLTEFHCQMHAVHPAGDHSLVLGRLRQVIQHQSDTPGLLFDQGRFGHFTSLVD